jgi:hypothetical protein
MAQYYSLHSKAFRDIVLQKPVRLGWSMALSPVNDLTTMSSTLDPRHGNEAILDLDALRLCTLQLHSSEAAPSAAASIQGTCLCPQARGFLRNPTR